MSGGSYDYACFKVNDMASELRNQDTDPKRKAFAELLRLVGEAMHDIEWVDSSDYGGGDEYKAIDKCFDYLSKGKKSYLEKSVEMLQDNIKIANELIKEIGENNG